MKNDKLLDVYLPRFSGFSTPGWKALLEVPPRHAAHSYALLEPRSAVCIEQDEFADIIEGVRDRRVQCASLGRAFCGTFNDCLALYIGFDPDLRFKDVHFAKDHGFRTDRIMAALPLRSAIAIFEMSEEKHHWPLNDVMPVDFAPYLGCTPDLDEDLRSNLAFLPVEDWDAAALGTLLEAFAGEPVEEMAFQQIAGRRAHEAFVDAVDWSALRKRVQGRRLKRARSVPHQDEQIDIPGATP